MGIQPHGSMENWGYGTDTRTLPPKPVLLGWGLSSYITDSVPGSVYAALGPSARRIRAFENEWELQVHGAMGNWGTWTRDQPLPPNQKKVGWGTRRYLRAGLMRVYI